METFHRLGWEYALDRLACVARPRPRPPALPASRRRHGHPLAAPPVPLPVCATTPTANVSWGRTRRQFRVGRRASFGRITPPPAGWGPHGFPTRGTQLDRDGARRTGFGVIPAHGFSHCVRELPRTQAIGARRSALQSHLEVLTRADVDRVHRPGRAGVGPGAAR